MNRGKEYQVALVITGDGKGGVKAIRANQEELDKLTQAQEKGKQKTQQYGKAHKDTEKDVSKFGKTVERGATIVAAAAAAATAALTAMFNVRARAVEADVNTAQMLDISTQSLQGQAYAASFLGIETQKYADILRDTTVRVQEFAAMGTGAAADFFELMNIEVAEFANLKPDELMRRIGEELKDLNQNERIMFLDQLGSQDAVLLGNVITQMGELEAEAVALGIALDDVDSQMLADSVAAMTRVEGVVTGAMNQISVGLAPVVSDLAGRFFDVALESGGIGDATERAMDIVVRALGVPANSLQRWQQVLLSIKLGFLEVGAAGAEAMTANAEATAEALNFYLIPFGDAVSWLTDKFAWLLEAASAVGGPIGRSLEEAAVGLRSFSATMSSIEIDSSEVIGFAEEMRASAIAARADLDALMAEPPAADQLVAWLEEAREKAEALAAATVAENEARRDAPSAISPITDATAKLVEQMEFENRIMGMNNLDRQIETNLRKLGINATREQRDAVRELTIARYNHEKAMKAEEEQAKLTGQIQENQIRNIQKAYGDFIYSFLSDGKLEFDEFFEYIGDGWIRTISEMGSAKLTSAMLSSGASGFDAVFGQSFSSLSDSIISKFATNSGLSDIFSGLGFGGDAIQAGADWSTGMPVASQGGFNSTQLLNGLKDMGLNIGAGFAGGFAGNELGEALFGKEAESAIGQSIGTAIGTYLGGPLGAFIGSSLGSMVDVMTGGDGKVRQNAGFLVGPTPGADPSRTFDVDPFSSGLQIQGFARRAERAQAMEVIETFRGVHDVVFGLIEELNGKLDTSKATFAGLDEEATAGSSGTFMGRGGNGQLAGDIMAQINMFVAQLADHASGLDDELLAAIRSAGSAEEAISLLSIAVVEQAASSEQAAAMAEEAATVAEKLAQAEEDLLTGRIDATRKMSTELAAIRSLRTAMSMDIYSAMGATPLRSINATVTEQIRHIEEQRQLLIRNHEQEMSAELQLHEARMQSAQSLSDFADSLRLGDMSSLSGADQLALAEQRWEETLAAAQGGDMNAVARLQQVAQAFAEESQYMNASGSAHVSVMDRILNGLDSVAGVMAASEYDPAAANQALIQELQALDQQLSQIAIGVNDSIISELQNINVTLSELSPDIQDSLTGAISQWVTASNPSANGIIEALSGIRSGIDVLPPEIAQYLSSVMSAFLQANGNQQRTVEDYATGSLTQNAGRQALIDQGFNLDYSADQISSHVAAFGAIGSGDFEAEVAAIRQLHADAVALGIGSAQIADNIGGTQQGIYDALIAAGIDPTGFANGGIARGPRSGYLELLHDTEAVIPLPDGRSVPVTMSGSANDAVVSELRRVREDNARLNQTMEDIRKDMRSGMIFSAQQRAEILAAEQEVANQVKRTGTGGSRGRIG